LLLYHIIIKQLRVSIVHTNHHQASYKNNKKGKNVYIAHDIMKYHNLKFFRFQSSPP